MSEHTKGPWVAMDVVGVWMVGIEEDRHLITKIPAGSIDAAANARLIASAPELLAACEEALAIAEDRQAGTWDDVMLLMRAAIAKARQP